MYKDYRVVEEIIKDYDRPQIDVVVQAPCGCQACEKKVQLGHPYCDVSPNNLINDDNVEPVFDNNRWYWSFHGSDEDVDEFYLER